ncbi:DUF6517 family protein [Salinilacihabitans rarus]|uniref:DUF6517 family protein n=1 Tax=Salinilacihabitans rarus TaxID=2961596 RepID=UPI0020C86125|nr:DUF6517 family protein [Salinilacihabitans rarus]
MDRRRFVAGLVAAGVGATAGCLDPLLAGATSREATPATVSAAAAAETGYVHDETRTEVDEEEVGGETVELTSHVAEYVRPVDLAGGTEVVAGGFAAIASPQVSIAGEEFNPVGEMDTRELTGFVRKRYADLSIGDSIGGRTVETLGTSVEVETFAGEATFDEDAPVENLETLDVRLDVARFEHGGDHLVVGGVYPEMLPGEQARVTTLIEGLEHGD